MKFRSIIFILFIAWSLNSCIKKHNDDSKSCLYTSISVAGPGFDRKSVTRVTKKMIIEEYPFTEINDSIFLKKINGYIADLNPIRGGANPSIEVLLYLVCENGVVDTLEISKRKIALNNVSYKRDVRIVSLIKDKNNEVSSLPF